MSRTFRHRDPMDLAAREDAGKAAISMPEGESLTQLQYAVDADINVLARRFGLDKVGRLPAASDPSYFGDATDLPDLRAVLDRARDAQSRFLELPPEVRFRFHNDPVVLHDWLQRPENHPEAVRLGLLARRVPPEPAAPPAPPAAS